MGTRMAKTLLALLVLSIVAGAAQAAPVTVTINFTQAVNHTDFFDFGGLTLSISAFSTSGPRSIFFGGSGLGVFGGGADDPQLDGLGPDETLRFVFSSPILLERVRFTLVGSNDDFTLDVDGSQFASGDLSNVIDFGANGSTFDFSVLENNDDYKIKKITFTFDTESVPEPGTLFLLSTGLLGAGILTRRRIR